MYLHKKEKYRAAMGTSNMREQEYNDDTVRRAAEYMQMHILQRSKPGSTGTVAYEQGQGTQEASIK